MKRHLLFEKLIRAARHNPPASQVPYAFEKRVMARLGPPVRDEWTAIARALCWSAGACCAIAMGISIWAFAFDEARESTAAATFSSELEQTILASINDFKFEPDFDLMEGELESLQ
jgi:hypothetical protein